MESDNESDGAFARGLRVLAAAYLLGLGTAAIVVLAADIEDPRFLVLAADLAAMLVVFAFSHATRCASVYDPYWSTQPIVIALWWALGPVGADGVALRQALTVLIVAAWGLRLTWNFLRGWPGLHHNDWRYEEMRLKVGALYPICNFLGLHVFPTLLVFVGCLPLLPIMQSDAGLDALGGIGIAVALCSVLLQGVSDQQLRQFVTSPDKKPGQIMKSGIWAWSRHPNYLGEMGLWWGLFITAYAAGGAWWLGAGALCITIMFLTVSIPWLDRRSLERRPGYAEHMKQVPGLIPRPWRRAESSSEGTG